MHFINGKCYGNTFTAVILYRERYLNAERHPEYRVFLTVHNTYSIGRLSSIHIFGGRPQKYNDGTILDEMENFPNISVRSFERTTGVMKSIDHRVLTAHEVQRAQRLFPCYYQSRTKEKVYFKPIENVTELLQMIVEAVD
ncbi:HTH_Tnp_Tc3_2 domain-containing protein [Trichonephila clavipes]|uniref:HTH_Tnp_Tc3_2 domain-containing protein n=1 Tax=Trichonephila clavipes TaxID=2585209 RepID=A0A8X6VPN4_TRICX|nr:HTH_Tnp_Tc3_2 domain-containing protein [Trichonephila clavipes]